MVSVFVWISKQKIKNGKRKKKRKDKMIFTDMLLNR